jgi:hypothetical protein
MDFTESQFSKPYLNCFPDLSLRGCRRSALISASTRICLDFPLTAQERLLFTELSLCASAKTQRLAHTIDEFIAC